MNIICKIDGHRIPTREEYPTAGCGRCGKDWEAVDRDGDFIGIRYWFGWRFWNAWRRIRKTLTDFRAWLHCPECGGKFGRHSERCNWLLPF